MPPSDPKPAAGARPAAGAGGLGDGVPQFHSPMIHKPDLAVPLPVLSDGYVAWRSASRLSAAQQVARRSIVLSSTSLCVCAS